MTELEDFSKQTARIRQKLEKVRKADRGFKVFGASSHKYRLAKPLSPRKLAVLEERYNSKLPPDLRAFLTEIGNGHPKQKPNHVMGGAGPYYGVRSAEDILKSVAKDGLPMLKSDMTDDEWKEAQASLDRDELDLDDLERGCAWIVSQGCTYWNLLVLSGPDRGRVINYDGDWCGTPRFAFERNFLDWYERWLDEILIGWVGYNSPSFGFVMGGDEDELRRAYAAASTDRQRADAVEGLFKLPGLSQQTIGWLVDVASETKGKVRRTAVEMLLKFARNEARPFVAAVGNDPETDFVSFSLTLSVRAPEFADLVSDRALAELRTCQDRDDFSRLIGLLSSTRTDHGPEIASYCTHDNADFRQSAVYSLGQLPNRQNHITTFCEMLRDPSILVVIQALDAVKGLDDPKLREEFAKLRSYRGEFELGVSRRLDVLEGRAEVETKGVLSRLFGR